jgi:hypothetical protein
MSFLHYLPWKVADAEANRKTSKACSHAKDGFGETSSDAFPAKPMATYGSNMDACCSKFAKSSLDALEAFNKPMIDHVFEFRREQRFEQEVVACPATVSLVSHFASGTYSHPSGVPELQKEGVRLSSFKVRL